MTADPIESIRHHITHAPKRGTVALKHVSDLEFGMRLWKATFDFRMERIINALADRELRDHWRRVEIARGECKA